jgi:hypothetical protein
MGWQKRVPPAHKRLARSPLQELKHFR